MMVTIIISIIIYSDYSYPPHYKHRVGVETTYQGVNTGSVTGLIRLVTDALSYLVVNNKRPRTSTFSMVAKF